MVYDNAYDAVCGRYTSNTNTEGSSVARGGECSKWSLTGPVLADGAKFRVCTDETYLPDPCGSWSATDRF